jgi:flagellar biosynthesis protein FliQ
MGGEIQLILHQALTELGVVAGPMLGALLVLGLGIGVVQAATQINDPAVGFVPRLTALLAVIWLLGPWAMQRLAAYFAASLQHLAR